VGYGGGAAVACTLALLRLVLSRRPLAARLPWTVRLPWTARLPWTTGEATAGTAVTAAKPAALPAAAGDATTDTTADTTTAEEPVLEPTAVLHPVITIGVGGKPDFSARNNNSYQEGLPGAYRERIT
jgi:hypothetical protein